MRTRGAVLFAWLVLVAALFASPLAAAPSLSTAQVRAIKAEVDAYLADTHAPGASVAVGLNDRLVFAQGYGYADVENRVRATAATAYRTASIGKSMTATAAMRLKETGKLDLDVPIQTYCPRFPAKAWPITTRDLISHTSGIRHYEGPNVDAEMYNLRHYDHVADALDIFDKDPLKQRPGDDFMYTTWGYVTLGCVLEGASGEDYRGLMRHLVFGPAGMADTRDDDPRALIPNRARGYFLDRGALRNSRPVDMSSKLPAGGWITTAPDLVRFMDAWMDGRLVNAATQKLMLTPYRLPRHKGAVDNFGLGWFLDTYHGMPMALYGGGTPQVSGFILFVPERRIAVAVIANLEDISAARRSALAEGIADVVLGETSPNRGYFNAPAAK